MTMICRVWVNWDGVEGRGGLARALGGNVAVMQLDPDQAHGILAALGPPGMARDENCIAHLSRSPEAA